MSTLVHAGSAGTGLYDTEIVEHWLHKPSVHFPRAERRQFLAEKQRALALFCYDDPSSIVGQYLQDLVSALVKWHTPVHIFSREPFGLDLPNVFLHVLGDFSGGGLLPHVEEFTRRASNAFLREFRDCSRIMLIGFEWASVPAISLLHSIKNVRVILSLHSLERQRSNMGEELSRNIEEIELTGLREARLILTHDPATAELAGRCLPACAERLLAANPMAAIQDFQFDLDPGEVKGRYQVGPTDPTLLYIGDLHENYGPDLLMKALPRVLKKHPQARCIFVGDGELLWPLRVYSRYLLLDYAVRLIGSLEGRPLHELIYAADVIVVPSRRSTPWWPIEAAWAAKHPVVVTYEAAPALVRHEQDSLLTEADEKGLASGINRVLSEPQLARNLGDCGRAKLAERYGVNRVAARIEELMGVPEAVEQPRELVAAAESAGTSS
jgi:glycosyltransferase involved in cell wall biosynthesis